MSDERPFYVIANWKMISSQKMVTDMCHILYTNPLDEEVKVIIGCPFPYLMMARSMLPDRFSLAGLNCYKLGKNGYTGEVPPNVLKDVGADYVLLGHSDRRTAFNETDDDIGEKTACALAGGLTVIICVGENFPDRSSGNTESVLSHQLSSIDKHIKDWSNVMLVYEPIWTIGTGKTARPHNIQTALAFIRKWLEINVSKDAAANMPLLYGGSISAANCRMLAAQPDVDGFLVGNSSLKQDFVQIINTFIPTDDKTATSEIYSQLLDVVQY